MSLITDKVSCSVAEMFDLSWLTWLVLRWSYSTLPLRPFFKEFGAQALLSVRYYVNTASKTSCNHQRIAFNQRCHLYQLLPCSLTIILLVPTSKGRCIAMAVYVDMRETLRWIDLQAGNEPFFQKWQLDHSFSSQHSAIIKRHEDEV